MRKPSFPTLLILVMLILLVVTVRQNNHEKTTPPSPVKTEQLPVNFILRPISQAVYSYVANAYAAHDKNQFVLIATWDDYCLGVPCEHWVLKTHPSQLPIMLRCYPTLGNQCVPTYEQPIVQIPDGNKPTITPVVGE